MIPNCFALGCSNLAAFRCNCALIPTFSCKTHLKNHLSFAGKHEIVTVLEPLHQDSLSELHTRILALLSSLSREETDLISFSHTLYETIQSNLRTTLTRIQSQKETLTEILTFAINNSVIIPEHRENINTIANQTQNATSPRIELLKSTVEKLASDSKDILLKGLLTQETNEQSPSSIKILCCFCNVGYIIKCAQHQLCPKCKKCFCNECKLKKVEPFEERYPQDLIMEELPFRESCDPYGKVCTYIYKGYNKTLERHVAVIKIVAETKTLAQQNVELLKFLGQSLKSFLWINGSHFDKKHILLITEFAVENLFSSLKLNLTEREMIKICRGLIEGFTFLAFHGIYHRNISPYSVLLSANKEPKIWDFSLAVGLESKFGIAQCNDKVIKSGIQGYLPPERFFMLQKNENQKFAYNIEKADVFSLGMVILQMFTKDEVFDLQTATEDATIDSYTQKVQNANIKTLLCKMLRINPDFRPYFSELLEDFNNLF
jgi:hypothetical protein